MKIKAPKVKNINTKSLFKDKKAASAIGVISVLAVAGAAIGLTKALKNTDIGKRTAKNIALDHAGLLEKNVQIITSKLSANDNDFFYNVSFISKGKIYNYEIDARSGDILGYNSMDTRKELE
ncbi:PepSY domain-containing protein [Alloiococcus sp. CFN-8]|uniref:PepSY domain-containing protein n=1 Tax=Alloiococcus sp. CFN-8 TaxID=3416081 RepID=UPI003CF4B280